MTNALNNPLSGAGSASLQQRVLLSVGMLCLPFLVFYWLLPGMGGFTIGNDYPIYPIETQLELSYSIEQDTFPLYLPGFAGGQSASAATLGQMYHPLTWVARWMPGYWDGHALTVNTLLRLLSIGLVNVLLFFTLRRCGLGNVVSFVISFAAIYHLRTLDMFRYGPSLENYLAFVSLQAFILLFYLNERSWKSTAGIVLSSYLLMVGGHPQIAFLGYLGAALCTLVMPFFVQRVGLVNQSFDLPQLIKDWSMVLAFVVLGALLAAPYVLTFLGEYMASTGLRTGNSYEWSTAFQDTLGGGLRSFYAPLASDAHGAFGSTVFWLVVLLSPILMLLLKQWSIPLLVVYGLFVLGFVVSLGSATPIHYLIWKGVPLADSFRVPGRFAIWMVFPALLLAVWAAKAIASNRLKASTDGGDASGSKVLATWLGIALLLFLVMSFGLDKWLPDSSNWKPGNINRMGKDVPWQWFALGGASLFLALILALDMVKQALVNRLLLLGGVVLIVLQSALALRWGTWIEPDKQMPSLVEMQEQKQTDFRTYGTPGHGMSAQTVDEQLERGFIEPRLARLYREVEVVASLEEAWRFLHLDRTSRQAVVADSAFGPLSDQGNDADDELELVRANFNEFEFDVRAQQSVLMATNIPYDESWQVSLNGERVETYRANGHELSVLLPAGQHEVHFQYRSAWMNTALFVSVVTMMVFLGICLAQSRSSKRLYFGLIPVLGAGALYYFAFAHQYGAASPDARYSWQSSDFPEIANVAYGKRTQASSMSLNHMPFLFNPSKAVDGNRDQGFFKSHPERQPSWKLDLGMAKPVNQIKVYGVDPQSYPITLWGSLKENGGYAKLGQVFKPEAVIEQRFETREIRYLVVAGARGRRLIMHEVELYLLDEPAEQTE